MTDRTPILSETGWRRLILGSFMIIVLFVIFNSGARTVIIVSTLLDDDNIGGSQPERQQQEILDRSREAVASSELILSFLEGASVFVTLALGAAAVYGFTTTGQLRDEIRDERDRNNKQLKERFDQIAQNIELKQENLEQKVRDELEDFEPLKQLIERSEALVREKLPEHVIENLDQLPEVVGQLDQMKDDLEHDITARLTNFQEDFVEMFQANQELSLRNYKEAYSASTRVLQRSPNNLQALYIAGWLELQYIPGKLQDGIQKLEKARDLARDIDTPSIDAAYAVGLRRRALNFERGSRAREEAMNEARIELERALTMNENLLDLNRESFWGPIGGIYRDIGKIDLAIESYEKALSITPGSSYPMGNLATLYLIQLKEGLTPKREPIEAFRKTIEFAERELANLPSDYYLMMDIAMASSVLTIEDMNQYDKEAREKFEQAISRNPTSKMMGVSLRGWERLKDSIPDEVEWVSVMEYIQTYIDDLLAAIEKRDDYDEAHNSGD